MKKTSEEISRSNSDSDVPRTLFLCCRFHYLSLNSFGHAFNSDQDIAISQQQNIYECNLSSKKQGVSTGQSLNHALMLCPGLEILERSVEKEQKKRLELAHWAYRYTSQVSPYRDNCLNLEIGKSISLFNSLRNLLNLIEHDLTEFNIDASFGIGYTPKAAYLLSFEADKQTDKISLSHCNINLNNIDIGHLEIDGRTKNQLLHCGFETLGDLNTIPNSELGSRFGNDFLDYTNKIKGLTADPHISIQPPEEFHACVDFVEPISNITWIDQQIERLLQDLVQFLQLRELACRHFTWHFFHENNHLLETIHIGVSGKHNTLEAFKELSQLKFDRLALRWEFSSIELSSKQLIPKQLFNNDLFNPQPDLEQQQQLVDKLVSRLGREALFRVDTQAEHLPELANIKLSANTVEPSACIKEPSARVKEPSARVKEPSARVKEPSARVKEPSATYILSKENHLKDQPLWLLERPKRLSKQADSPLHEGPLNLVHGPSRISSHWWSKLQSRDYFIARQANGRLLWIYQDRINQHWFLHGLFA